jgi:hypothetical protein
MSYQIHSLPIFREENAYQNSNYIIKMIAKGIKQKEYDI